MPKKVPVSVVISALNEGCRLAETIASITSADVMPVEILVVDDGSVDGCAEGLEACVSDASCVRVFRQSHRGIARARDYGASAAEQPVLVFLDAHCAVAKDWLTPLVETVRRDPDSIAIPTIGDAKRPADRGCGARLINDLLVYQWITRDPPPFHAGVAPGGCFAIRQETLRRLGGFAAMSDFGVEDVELSLRAWRMGCSILTVPESLVLHDFRKETPYKMRAESWLANVLLAALLHFDSDRIARTIRAAGGLASFPRAIATVLSSEWLDRKAWIDARAVRPMDAYWRMFDPF